MKNKILTALFNIGFIIIILSLGIYVATIGLTKKIDDYQKQNTLGITATVEKKDVPIIALNRGLIKFLHVKEGDRVRKGDLLVEITNPIIEEQIKSLAAYPDNVSARTQIAVAEAELSYNKLFAPVDGVIGSLNVTTDSPVDEYSQIMGVFSDDDTKLLTYLTIEQYLEAEKISRIPVYNPRLDQIFYASPDSLKPNQVNPDLPKEQSNKIAYYLKLTNAKETSSLINGEQLEVRLGNTVEDTNKPVELFVNFWSNIF